MPQNTPKSNNMIMVSKEPCGRWGFFWWICYQLLSERLNTHETLLLSHLTCQSISRQVIVFSFCSDCFATNNPIEAFLFFLYSWVTVKCCQSQEMCPHYFVNITILGSNACWMLQKMIHLARKPFPNFFCLLSMKLCHLPCCRCSTEVKNFIHWLRDSNPFNCPTLKEILKHP